MKLTFDHEQLDYLLSEMVRKGEIKTFFMENLQTIGMRDAIVLTKERFNLPDDYTMSIDTIVSFRITSDTKTEEPNVD